MPELTITLNGLDDLQANASAQRLHTPLRHAMTHSKTRF